MPYCFNDHIYSAIGWDLPLSIMITNNLSDNDYSPDIFSPMKFSN